MAFNFLSVILLICGLHQKKNMIRLYWVGSSLVFFRSQLRNNCFSGPTAGLSTAVHRTEPAP